MVEQSKDIILKVRFTEAEADRIKAICQEKSEQWGRLYTVSDFFRDAACLYRTYHDVKDQMASNKDVLIQMIARLPGSRPIVQGTDVP